MPLSSLIVMIAIVVIAFGVFIGLMASGEEPIEPIWIVGLAVVGVIVVVILCTSGRKSNSWLLEFEGDVLYLKNLGTKKEFKNWDSPLSDMKMKLTSEKNNVGSLVIKGTSFRIEGIQNFKEMKAYIEANYKN